MRIFVNYFLKNLQWAKFKLFSYFSFDFMVLRFLPENMVRELFFVKVFLLFLLGSLTFLFIV